METKIFKIDKNNVDLKKISEAAEAIKKGGIVAFPTDTVYGLGADAFNEKAVAAIFLAKGRTPANPLSVLVSSKKDLRGLCREIPKNAEKLMDKFWPGPLTIILKKSYDVPSIVTAGLETLGVRMPADKIALELIEQAGVPIAAPSANISGGISPTEADSVISELSGLADVIIDGGDTDVGIDSTILDMTIEPPAILRPGTVTKSEIEKVLGISLMSSQASSEIQPHYSPKAELILIDGRIEHVQAKIVELTQEFLIDGKKVGILASEQTKASYPDGEVVSAGDRNEPQSLAGNIFKVLRQFDKMNTDIILAESMGDEGIAGAVTDRLEKAAQGNVIRV